MLIADGGLKVIDLQSINKALISTWVKKYLEPEKYGKWKYFFDSELLTKFSDAGNLYVNKSRLSIGLNSFSIFRAK